MNTLLLLSATRLWIWYEVGFHSVLEEYSRVLDLTCVWNINLHLLSSVLPNLRECGNPKLTLMVERLGDTNGITACLLTTGNWMMLMCRSKNLNSFSILWYS